MVRNGTALARRIRRQLLCGLKTIICEMDNSILHIIFKWLLRIRLFFFTVFISVRLTLVVSYLIQNRWMNFCHRSNSAQDVSLSMQDTVPKRISFLYQNLVMRVQLSIPTMNATTTNCLWIHYRATAIFVPRMC